MPNQPVPQQHKALLEQCLQWCQALLDNPALEHDPRPVLIKTMSLFRQCFEVERCSLALWDPVQEKICLQALSGDDQVQPFWLALGQGITGTVVRDRVAILANDVTQDPRFDRSIDRQTGFTTRSMICVPLQAEDQIIGALAALNTAKPGGFTTEDIDLLWVWGGLLSLALMQSQRLKRLRNARQTHRQANERRYTFVPSRAPAMQAIETLAYRVARYDTTVLLTGETGTGKEIIARAIHRWSPRGGRSDHTLVPVNCMALTPTLAENELFGHEKGAYTGADSQYKGKLELAEGSTLFLDEVGELSPALQVTLLRVLDEKRFWRLGGSREIPLNIRLIAATNRNLPQAIKEGTFREDLYFRLKTFIFHLPPLRERREDIPDLVENYKEYYCNEMKLPPMAITADTLALLQQYAWPGNIRELKNVIERALVLASGPTVTPDLLPSEILQGTTASTPEMLPFTQHTLEAGVTAYKRARIQQALRATHWNQRQAARQLGVAPGNLAGMLKRLGIPVPRPTAAQTEAID